LLVAAERALRGRTTSAHKQAHCTTGVCLVLLVTFPLFVVLSVSEEVRHGLPVKYLNGLYPTDIDIWNMVCTLFSKKIEIVPVVSGKTLKQRKLFTQF